VKSEEMLGAMLLSWNNVAYYQSLMADIRVAIAAGRYADFAAETKAEGARGDIPARPRGASDRGPVVLEDGHAVDLPGAHGGLWCDATGKLRGAAMKAVFVQVKCQIGKAYKVAEEIAEAEIASADTFPSCHEDAAAPPDGPGGGYLRVYRHPGMPDGLPAWFWVACDGHVGTAYGYKTTAKEAAPAAEGAWTAIRRGRNAKSPAPAVSGTGLHLPLRQQPSSRSSGGDRGPMSLRGAVCCSAIPTRGSRDSISNSRDHAAAAIQRDPGC
jgi:hypothetical protein